MQAIDLPTDLRNPSNRKILLGCVLFFGGFAWWFFGIRYADMLYAIQDGDIFLYDRFFATSQILRPAGLHFYGTSFLIQFFYYPWLGGAILALELCGIAWLMAKLLCLRGLAYPVAFVPSGLLMIFLTQIGYLITEYDFLPLYVGTIHGLGISLLWSYVPALWRRRSAVVRITLDAVWLMVGYPLFGIFALLASFWAMARIWVARAEYTYLFTMANNTTVSHSKMNASSEAVDHVCPSSPVCVRYTTQCVILETLANVAFILCIPLLFYQWHFGKMLSASLIWTVGLQTDVVSLLSDVGVTFGSWKSVGLALVVSGLLPILSYVGYRFLLPRFAGHTFRVFHLRKSFSHGTGTTSVKRSNNSTSSTATIQKTTQKSKTRSTGNTSNTTSSLRYSLPFLFLILLCGVVVRFSFSDETFLATLAMGRQLESQRWEKMLEIASRCDRPSFSMISLRNLALFELSEAADNMFMWPQTSIAAETTEVAFIRKGYSAQILYRYGMVNHAQRATMNRIVSGFYPTPESLKMLANVAIVQQNVPLARRCLDMLRKTLFHRHWADQRLTLLNRYFSDTAMSPVATTDSTSPPQPSGLAAMDSDPLALDYDHISRRVPRVDSFNQQKQAQAVIYAQLLDQPHRSDDLPEMQELQLVYYLMGGELDLFEQTVAGVQIATQKTKLPKHFQEALVLFATERPEILQKYTIFPAISQRFDQLYPYLMRYRQDHDFPKLQTILQNEYPDTYWHFILNQQLTLPFEPNLR